MEHKVFKDLKVLLNSMEDIEKCAVCFEVFKSPQLLHCGHSLCKTCTQDLMKESFIKCPMCRETCHISFLKPNLTMNELLAMGDKIKHALKSLTEEGIGSRCGICEDLPAEYFCRTCCVFTCRICDKVHKKYTGCSEKSTDALQQLVEAQVTKAKQCLKDINCNMERLRKITTALPSQELKKKLQSYKKSLKESLQQKDGVAFLKVSSHTIPLAETICQEVKKLSTRLANEVKKKPYEKNLKENLRQKYNVTSPKVSSYTIPLAERIGEEIKQKCTPWANELRKNIHNKISGREEEWLTVKSLPVTWSYERRKGRRRYLRKIRYRKRNWAGQTALVLVLCMSLYVLIVCCFCTYQYLVYSKTRRHYHIT